MLNGMRICCAIRPARPASITWGGTVTIETEDFTCPRNVYHEG